MMAAMISTVMTIPNKLRRHQLAEYSPLTVKLSFGERFFAVLTKAPYEPIELTVRLNSGLATSALPEASPRPVAVADAGRYS